jgi:hypothetical protein
MPRPLKAFHIEPYADSPHSFRIWSDLSRDQIQMVDGVSYTCTLIGFVDFRIDPRYGEEDVLSEIRKLAQEHFKSETLEVKVSEEKEK